MLVAGVLLLVAAHWDGLGPAARIVLLLSLLVGLHGGAAAAATRFEGLSVTLHAVGTATLGAAIFLIGQTFHLDTHWPAGFLLWALGAWAGVVLLRQWPQAIAAALLTPVYAVAKWEDLTAGHHEAERAVVAGLTSLAFAYLLAEGPTSPTAVRRGLAWIGTIAIIPLAVILVGDLGRLTLYPDWPARLRLLGWGLWLGLPLVLSVWLRPDRWDHAAIAAAWVATAATLPFNVGVRPYIWSAAAALLLVASGVVDGSRRRINLGMGGFGLTVLAFYLSSVMDRLDRATSLLTGGALFLALAWGLEKARRRLVERAVRGDGA
jgi:uncharacterized membrane protein